MKINLFKGLVSHNSEQLNATLHASCNHFRHHGNWKLITSYLTLNESRQFGEYHRVISDHK